MKKILSIMVVLILVTSVLLTGCSSEVASADDNQNRETDIQNNNGNKGITVNKINFETISDSSTLSQEIQNAIENLKTNKGYTFFEHDGGYILVVFMGEKSSGGYSIDVISVEDNEGRTNVTVKETAPAKGDMVITAMTYPYAVITMKGVTDNFAVTNSDGESFKLLTTK